MKHNSIFTCLFLGICGLQAQQIDFFVTEYTHSNYQLDATTLVPMGTRTDWNWPSFSFYAAIDIPEGSPNNISDTALTGQFAQGDLLIPWSGEGYDTFLNFDNEQLLKDEIKAGAYTFTGTGNAGLGNFNEMVTLPAYVKLTDRRVTNFNQLQAFDPDQPVTISWEPFTEGQGTLDDGVTPRGFIEIWVDYWDESLGSQYVWSHLEEPGELNSFGALDATKTSVTIPAGTFTGSPGGYSVDIYFLRIDSYEDGQSVNGSSVVQLRSMDTILDIWPKEDVNPWETFPQLTNDWIDGGNWLGLLNVKHAPWIYSHNEQDYVFIPNDAVYQEGSWMWVPAPALP